MQLSVIIPIYNTSRGLLEKCISSIQENLYSFVDEIEVLLINDGSTEPYVEEILKQTEKKDSRFKYLYKSNSGLSSTRNMGINMAQGKYVTFVDADDYLEPDALRYMVGTIERANTNVAGFGFCQNDEKAEIIPFRHSYTGAEKEIIIRNNIHYEDAKFRGFIFCMVWAKIYRREFLLQNKLYFVEDSLVSEDILYSISVLQKSDSFFVDNKIVYHYVTNNNSITHEVSNRHISVAINTMPKLEEFVTCYYPNNNLFIDILTKMVYYNVRCSKEQYFTHPQNTKSFWELKSEMDDFLRHPNISKWLKRLKLLDAEDMIDFKNRLMLKLHLYWIFLITERRKRRKSFM